MSPASRSATAPSSPATSVRTGVTAVWPRGKQSSDPVFGGFFSQNGNGDMTGTHWLEESGFLDGPVLITNTHSVGVVRDAYLAWLVKNKRKPGTNVFDGGFYTYPIVAETYDGFLNDINGFHVKPEDVYAALDSGAARPGRRRQRRRRHRHGLLRLQGRHRHLFPQDRGGGYTVGVLVQCNCGSRRQLRIGGLPVGQELADNPPLASVRHALPRRHRLDHHRGRHRRPAAAAPDQAPRPPRHHGPRAHRFHLRQRLGRHLHRLLHRQPATPPPPRLRSMSPCCRTTRINGVFEAAVQATEEAIVNAMVGAKP